MELAEAQAEGYDSDDGSLDDEQWREIEHRSRRHPVRGTMKVTRAIDDNDRIAVSQQPAWSVCCDYCTEFLAHAI